MLHLRLVLKSVSNNESKGKIISQINTVIIMLHGTGRRKPIPPLLFSLTMNNIKMPICDHSPEDVARKLKSVKVAASELILNIQHKIAIVNESIDTLDSKIREEDEIIKNLSWAQQVAEEKYASVASKLSSARLKAKKLIKQYMINDKGLVTKRVVPEPMHLDVAITILKLLGYNSFPSWATFLKLVSKPKSLELLLAEFSLKHLKKPEYEEAKEVIEKYGLYNDMEEIKQLNSDWGGLVYWLLKVLEQYELRNKSEDLIVEIEKAINEKNKYVGNCLYLKQERDGLKEQEAGLIKCTNFIKENIEALEQFNIVEDEPIPKETLLKLSTIFNKCKIANMIARSNGIPVSSHAKENDYELPLNENLIQATRSIRHETEEFEEHPEKKLKIGKRFGCSRTQRESKNDYHEDLLGKFIPAGDNDLPSDSRDKLVISEAKIEVENKEQVQTKVEVKERATDTTEHYTKVADAPIPAKSAPQKEKKIRSTCMCSCS